MQSYRTARLEARHPRQLPRGYGPVWVATLDGQVQRPSKLSLERAARMYGFAIGDDHKLDRKVEHRTSQRAVHRHSELDQHPVTTILTVG